MGKLDSYLKQKSLYFTKTER